MILLKVFIICLVLILKILSRKEATQPTKKGNKMMVEKVIILNSMIFFFGAS